MVVLVVLMLAILLVAGAVVVYVAFPHRGEEVPGAPWLGDVMQRGVETVGELLEAPGEWVDSRTAERSGASAEPVGGRVDGRQHAHR